DGGHGGATDTESYWILPVKGRQLLIGVLALGHRRQKYLSVADYYWGSHEEIYKDLIRRFPIRKMLWGGEMLIENDLPHEAYGKVVLSINTAGFLRKKMLEPGSVHKNDPMELEKALNTF